MVKKMTFKEQMEESIAEVREDYTEKFSLPPLKHGLYTEEYAKWLEEGYAHALEVADDLRDTVLNMWEHYHELENKYEDLKKQLGGKA